MDYFRVRRDPAGIGRKLYWDLQLPRAGLIGTNYCLANELVVRAYPSVAYSRHFTFPQPENVDFGPAGGNAAVITFASAKVSQ
jgi:hypothetical protein